nr:MAG TPA: hypothetical protein [Caudoviricetes sp.]
MKLVDFRASCHPRLIPCRHSTLTRLFVKD